MKSTPRIGTATDAKGEFRLQGIPSGKQTIVFTFIGMVPFEVEYANQRDLEVVLKEDATQVNEVVVTGIYSRDKNSFAGSATTYTGKELRAIGTKNVFQSLKTLEPALTLVENRAFGSDPNRLPDLEIRGKTSLVGDLTTEYDNTANQPLFILDGIEVEIAQIQNLSMDRIASVTVLKDAASAAIYGSKASNGVIVVETVKPEPGQLRVSYSADLRFEFPDLSDYNLMNAEEKLRYEVLAGRYVGEDQDQLDALYNSRLAEVMRGVDTYWLSVPLRSVLNHTHSVYIDGGSEAMLYFVGYFYHLTHSISDKLCIYIIHTQQTCTKIAIKKSNEGAVRAYWQVSIEKMVVSLFLLSSHFSLVWSCFLSNFYPRISSDFGLLIWHKAAMFDIFSNRR